MARDFAWAFYHSKAWKSTRDSYYESVPGHLCEKCLKRGLYTPGSIVHHKTHLSPDNINDTSVTLSFDNLELVCRKCHAEEHPEIYGERQPMRVSFDADGNIVGTEGL